MSFEEATTLGVAIMTVVINSMGPIHRAVVLTLQLRVWECTRI